MSLPHSDALVLFGVTGDLTHKKIFPALYALAKQGAFYETAGCLRDVIQNHLFQVVALLAMEPPAVRDFAAVHSEKAKVFQAIRPLTRRVKHKGKAFVGDQRELYLIEEEPGEESPYERLLGDAMTGDGSLFTREDAVEAAWTVVDPVLKTHHRAHPYKPGSWGPKEADILIADDGAWYNPKPEEASA